MSERETAGYNINIINIDLCRNDTFPKTLYYTWNASTKKFKRRKQEKPVDGWPSLYSTDALGPTSFDTLRTVDGVVCTTYREACQKLQLLKSNYHWEPTLEDAAIINHP